MVSQPLRTLVRYCGTGNRRSTTFTVGRSSNAAVGEYSTLIRPSPSTSKRASPADTVAPWVATPSAKFTGVDRLTGDAGDVAVAAKVAGAALARPAAAIGMPSATAAIAAGNRRRLRPVQLTATLQCARGAANSSEKRKSATVNSTVNALNSAERKS